MEYFFNKTSLRQTSPCGKNLRGGSRIQRGTSPQGINAQDFRTGATPRPPARRPSSHQQVDAGAALVEVADADAVTVRIDGTGADVDFLEQALAGGEVVADDRVDHDLLRRRLFVLAEKGLLFVPVLRGRVGVSVAKSFCW